jgi:hypothetical protein
MKLSSMTYAAILPLLLVMAATPNASAQAITATPPGGILPGRAGIPNVTQQQAIALVQMDAELQPLIQNVTLARAGLAMAIFLEPRNDQAVQTQVANVQAAELALAKARAIAFAKVQSTPNKLQPNQITAFAGMGASAGGAPSARRGGAIPDITHDQITSLVQMISSLQSLTQATAAARAALATASISGQNAATLQADADALGKAELALAKARADAFTRLQTTPDKLAPAQVAALTASGGAFTAPVPVGYGNNNGPTPLIPQNFNDHEGYISLFDGTSLKGWDGNPKFWRVEGGDIVGESTAQNPSGNQYIVYKDIQAHDFTLKLEIKVDNAGGSGVQYRSLPNIPWTSALDLKVEANTGPVNTNWLLTGPQADFWPGTDPATGYTGQFYSENNPMRIMATRGNVVEGAGLGPKRLMGTIGDYKTLYNAVKPTGWNEYTIIARGGTFIHLINGQLMSVMVDDDPNSLNNKNGYIGIEIESAVKVHVRNVWLKKLN